MSEDFEKDTEALLEGLIEEDVDMEGEAVQTQEQKSTIELLPKEVQERIPRWKLQFGDVIVTTIGDKHYVWRTLQWNEYKEVQRQLLKLFPVPAGADANDMEMADMDRRFANMELTVQKCLLYPAVDLSSIGRLGPGVLYTLHQNISDASGFEPEFVEKL
jgi:hypothetical protein